ncbi:MAG: hypothetical protein RR573_00160 [Oscillospiraceae bacterium]
MVDYAFYAQNYFGNSIAAADFPRLSARAEAQLAHYKKMYTVSGDINAENMAKCAMADALYYFETAANGGITTSASVGGVSTSRSAAALPDTSAKSIAAELYRTAAIYLDIYRGC